MTTAIQIRGLSKVYSPTVTAVQSLDLEVPAGQILGFLGPNGAGKTTTIKMICGLISPTSGEVTLNGYSLRHNRAQAMQQIGAVLEGTRNLYWRFSAWQNLMYFARLKGVSAKAVKGYAENLLKELDLWERRHNEVGTFSRGMQQKIAIACAIIANPPIILLDEPTLGLDVAAARTVRNWIPKLAHEMGKTVVITTHQLDMAEQVCEQIAIINKGQLITHKPTRQLLSLFEQEFYQIRVRGQLTTSPSPSLTFEASEDETILTGSIPSQRQLNIILNELYRQDIPILAVNRVDANLEAVFMQLVKEGQRATVVHTDLQ